MKMTSNVKTRTFYPFHIQLILAIVIGLVLFGIIGCVVLLRFEVNQRDRIHSGLSMAGVDLSDMTISEAAAAIQQNLTYPDTGRLLIVDEEKSWLVSPAQLGFQIDAMASAKNAYANGRDGGVINKLRAQMNASDQSVSLSPVVVYDQRVAYEFLQNIANQIDTPVIEASLGVNGVEVVVNSGQIGRQLDIESSLKQIDKILMALQDGAITLDVVETAPVILDVTDAAEQAKNILKEPLVLKLPEEIKNAGPWTITPEELAKFLVIERQKNGNSTEFKVSLDRNLLIIYLSSLAPTLKTGAINARYIFNDDTRLLEVIEPAVIGHTLNVEASLKEIVARVMAGEHQIMLQMDLDEPDAKDDTTGEELGITELVHAQTSYFYGSDPGRVQNIAAAAKSFHGLLIPPGATFSMASALGNISLDNGYAEALIIVGDQTIKGVGGGVCQVSTTLFRTAFFAGYPIVERNAHAYRVGYYEQRPDGSRDPSLAGLDATVYVPLVDLRFTNDTPYWLLMETYMGNYSLTWKFYSTKDGRTMEWDSTGATDIVEAPEPLYRENPELEQGEIKQVDYAAEGAYVSVTRTVYKSGEVYFQDTFTTQYRPWQAVFEYGPGTEGIPTPTPTP
jgi:vancomycin resistance protein YoaR